VTFWLRDSITIELGFLFLPTTIQSNLSPSRNLFVAMVIPKVDPVSNSKPTDSSSPMMIAARKLPHFRTQLLHLCQSRNATTLSDLGLSLATTPAHRRSLSGTCPRHLCLQSTLFLQ
jgi:hypothetical protein